MNAAEEMTPHHKNQAIESLYYRVIDELAAIAVYPIGCGDGQLALVRVGIDDSFYYSPAARAIEAAKVWTGEGDPLDGWYRNPNTGRRRAGGDPSKEEVRP